MRSIEEMKTSNEASESNIRDEIRSVSQAQPADSAAVNQEQILASMQAMLEQFTTQMTE